MTELKEKILTTGAVISALKYASMYRFIIRNSKYTSVHLLDSSWKHHGFSAVIIILIFYKGELQSSIG